MIVSDEPKFCAIGTDKKDCANMTVNGTTPKAGAPTLSWKHQPYSACGAHLQGSGKTSWPGSVDKCVEIALSWGHTVAKDGEMSNTKLSYVQNAGGRCYFYSGEHKWKGGYKMYKIQATTPKVQCPESMCPSSWSNDGTCDVDEGFCPQGFGCDAKDCFKQGDDNCPSKKDGKCDAGVQKADGSMVCGPGTDIDDCQKVTCAGTSNCAAGFACAMPENQGGKTVGTCPLKCQDSATFVDEKGYNCNYRTYKKSYSYVGYHLKGSGKMYWGGKCNLPV